jgi:hypothetical protein
MSARGWGEGESESDALADAAEQFRWAGYAIWMFNDGTAHVYDRELARPICGAVARMDYATSPDDFGDDAAVYCASCLARLAPN